jgi:RNA polymerase sigma factor FliA
VTASPELDVEASEVRQRFESGLPLVDAIANQLMRGLGAHVERQELQALGREGLLMAARRFDPGRGVPFRGYASFRVRGAMIDGVRAMGHLPRRVHQQLRAAQAADLYSESVAEDTAPPDQSRIEAQRALDDHLAGMATAMAIGLVAEAVTGEDGRLTGGATGPDPEQAVEGAELRDLLRRQIEELPEQEAELIRRHYLGGERFDHVAQDLGLSKSWASRLHTRAVDRLTKRLRQLA